MTLEEAKKTLQTSNGNHLDSIYVPSLGRNVYFKPISTADAKTLTRVSFTGEYDVSV